MANCARCKIDFNPDVSITLQANYVFGPMSFGQQQVERIEIRDFSGRVIETVLPEVVEARLAALKKDDLEEFTRLINKGINRTQGDLQRLRELDELLALETVQVFETVSVQKTHLVCSTCLDLSDTIIWGVNK